MPRELPQIDSRPSRGGRTRYALLAVALVLAGLAGYGGYVLFPRFDQPSVVGLGLVALAAGAGVASFFSPCSFPLLLTLLSRGIAAERGGGRVRAALLFGGTFAAGAAAFNVILGLLIGLGGRGLAGSITFTSGPGIALRIAVGTLLVLLGLVQANVIPISFHAVERTLRPLGEAHARLRRDRPLAGWALFGFGYLLIGFG
jgi:cytochrome c biogenesis protein CcdA